MEQVDFFCTDFAFSFEKNRSHSFAAKMHFPIFSSDHKVVPYLFTEQPYQRILTCITGWNAEATPHLPPGQGEADQFTSDHYVVLAYNDLNVGSGVMRFYCAVSDGLKACSHQTTPSLSLSP